MAVQHGMPGEWAKVRGTVLSLWPLFLSFTALGAFATALVLGRCAPLFGALLVVTLVFMAVFWRKGLRRIEPFFKGARGEEWTAQVLSALPENCLMYDWWISLAAAAFGRVLYLNEATIDYRQHGNNQVGAKNVKSAAYLRSRLSDTDALRRALLATCDQAAAFSACFRDRLGDGQKRLVEEYAALPKLSKAEKLRTLKKLGTLKCGTLRRLGQILLI